jgi:hypothetical protein
VAGAKSGWAEYQSDATNVFTSVRDVSKAAFTGLADQMTAVFTTGKSNFKSFTTSMLKMLVQITNQLIVAYTVQQAMGWIGGGLNPPHRASLCRLFLPQIRRRRIYRRWGKIRARGCSWRRVCLHQRSDVTPRRR